jgi:hypothetical protein
MLFLLNRADLAKLAAPGHTDHLMVMVLPIDVLRDTDDYLTGWAVCGTDPGDERITEANSTRADADNVS